MSSDTEATTTSKGAETASSSPRSGRGDKRQSPKSTRSRRKAAPARSRRGKTKPEASKAFANATKLIGGDEGLSRLTTLLDRLKVANEDTLGYFASRCRTLGPDLLSKPDQALSAITRLPTGYQDTELDAELKSEIDDTFTNLSKRSTRLKALDKAAGGLVGNRVRDYLENYLQSNFPTYAAASASKAKATTKASATSDGSKSSAPRASKNTTSSVRTSRADKRSEKIGGRRPNDKPQKTSRAQSSKVMSTIPNETSTAEGTVSTSDRKKFGRQSDRTAAKPRRSPRSEGGSSALTTKGDTTTSAESVTPRSGKEVKRKKRQSRAGRREGERRSTGRKRDAASTNTAVGRSDVDWESSLENGAALSSLFEQAETAEPDTAASGAIRRTLSGFADSISKAQLPQGLETESVSKMVSDIKSWAGGKIPDSIGDVARKLVPDAGGVNWLKEHAAPEMWSFIDRQSQAALTKVKDAGLSMLSGIYDSVAPGITALLAKESWQRGVNGMFRSTTTGMGPDATTMQEIKFADGTSQVDFTFPISQPLIMLPNGGI